MLVNTGSFLIDVTGAEGVKDWPKFIPERMSPGAVGYDVKACHWLDAETRTVIGDFPVTIEPGGFALFGIGVIMAIPPGIDAQVRPRSGLATKRHVILANGPGTIDPDYRGEVACSMYNVGDEPFTLNRGDRVAQLIFTPIILPSFHQVTSVSKLPVTTRADGGFGSTGISGPGFGTDEYDLAQREVDVYLMRLVLATAARSNCIRGCQKGPDGRVLRDKSGRPVGQKRRLGCVIARGDKIIATGYNAQYRGSQLCANVGCLRDERNIPSGQQLEVCRAIHAEEMAINSAANEGASVRGCTIYCNAEPCLGCARRMAGLEISGLVVLEGGYSSGQEGLEIVRSAGIPTREIKSEWLK